MTESEQWFVVKQNNGQCAILPASAAKNSDDCLIQSEVKPSEQWGPFDSQAEAIARRVGLIRAGKCQPA